MTSDSITPPDPDEIENGAADAVVPPPPAFDDAAADAVVPPPPVFDDDRASVVVPPPPSFDGPLTGSVPPLTSSTDDVVPPPPAFEGSTGDAVVPPPPAFDASGAGAPASESLRRRTPPAFPPAAAPDASSTAPEPDPAFVAPEVPASGGYRAWTVAIFSILVLLLAGAIALVIYLATSTTLNFPSFDDASSDGGSSTVATSAPAADADALPGVGVVAGQPCSDFCGEVSRAVGASVVGADGAVRWGIAEPWTSADGAAADAVEQAVGTYSSSAGSLEFTVWRFDDDTSALAGFDAQTADRGEPVSSDTVYGDGRGQQRTFSDAEGMTIFWVVADDDGNPWVLKVTGPDDATNQFYLALPI